MRKLILILALLFVSWGNVIAEESLNKYKIDTNGNVEIIEEHNYSKTHNFKNYTITGTFEDNLGNYGSSSTAVIAEYKEGKVINLQWSSKLSYQNNNVIFAFHTYVIFLGLLDQQVLEKDCRLLRPKKKRMRGGHFCLLA